MRACTQSARLVRAVLEPVDKTEPRAESAELRRKRESCGPGAHDQHVEIDLYPVGGFRPHDLRTRSHIRAVSSEAW